LRGGIGAQGDEPVFTKAPDHVQIDHRRHAPNRDRWMLDEVGGSRQTDLFSGKERDQDTAAVLGILKRTAQLLADHHRGHGPGSVIIGAVVDRVLVRAHRMVSTVA
jgi:hypothetical protein